MLEYLWGFGQEDLRFFYQGLLHLAVSMYHLRKDNKRGSKSLINSGIELLRPYGQGFGDIDIERLLSEALRIRETLENENPIKGVYLKIRKRKGR